MSVRILLIDNYDSFTYNLVQAFAAEGAEVIVHRNDALTTKEAEALKPSHLIISPGPGRPEQAGQSLAMIDAFCGKIPILGVCLGHQSLIQHFGGNIIAAKRLMHGKVSYIEHDSEALYEGLPQPFAVGRYHSLAAEQDTLPDVLTVTSRTEDGEIMGVRHQELPIEGVQFHPESVLTPDGDKLMRNFIQQATV